MHVLPVHALAILTLAATIAHPSAAACVASSGDVVAKVLGVPIRADEIEPSPAEMQDVPAGVDRSEWTSHLQARALEARIVGSLHQRFCATHACDATKSEVQAVLDMGGMPTQTPQAMDLARRAAREWVGNWKFHKALYETYGGDVIMQVVAPNAVGARRAWLEAEEAKGHFQIVTAELRAAFFDVVSAYGGRPVSPERATEAFAHPPWEDGAVATSPRSDSAASRRRPSPGAAAR